MALFVQKSFTSHAGKVLPFKIECDVLTTEDLETIASVFAPTLTFSRVYGIPNGGLLIAQYFQKYCSSTGPVLIVDDVYTTGMSMEAERLKHGTNSIGFVIFSRGILPSWIQYWMQLNPKLF